MGMIQCPKHGLQGIAINIQEEVCAKILNSEQLTADDLSVIKVLVYDDGEFLFDMNYLLLTETCVKMNLQEEYTVTDEEQADLKILNNMSGALCAVCFAKYPYSEAIKPVLHIYEQHKKPASTKPFL